MPYAIFHMKYGIWLIESTAKPFPDRLPSCRQNQGLVVISARVDLLRIQINAQRLRKFTRVTADARTNPCEKGSEERRVGRARAVIQRQPLYAVGENSDLVNRAGSLLANDFFRRIVVGQKVGHVGVLALLRPAYDRIT